MPRCTKEIVDAKKDEIIDACAKLYETTSFREITIKEIGKGVSFCRTTIYNYFETKEEIFLALLKREFAQWADELTAFTEENESVSKAELADNLAQSLSKHERMLKLMSMNLYCIEENSRIERLVEFKMVYGEIVEAMKKCLKKFCFGLDDEAKQEFIALFFPFIYGIYPFAIISAKQQEAMKRANCNCKPMSIYEIAKMGIEKLLGA